MFNRYFSKTCMDGGMIFLRQNLRNGHLLYAFVLKDLSGNRFNIWLHNAQQNVFGIVLHGVVTRASRLIHDQRYVTRSPKSSLSWVELNWLFNVTINDISVIYVTAHRCAGGLKKKLDLRSGSQRHRHFVGFFNVPVLAPTRDHPFYTVIPTHRPI